MKANKSKQKWQVLLDWIEAERHPWDGCETNLAKKLDELKQIIKS